MVKPSAKLPSDPLEHPAVGRDGFQLRVEATGKGQPTDARCCHFRRSETVPSRLVRILKSVLAGTASSRITWSSAVEIDWMSWSRSSGGSLQPNTTLLSAEG